MNINSLYRTGILIFAAAASSWLIGFLLLSALARWGVIDRPNERSSHSVPTPRGGGIAILLALAVIAILKVPLTIPLLMIGIATILLAAISFADDMKSVSQLLRFSVHILAALAALLALSLGESEIVTMRGVIAWWLFGLLWIVGNTNSFNFMDGINGLAGSQTVIVAIGMALIALAAGSSVENPALIILFALSGAAMGFLPYNFPRARMFLGDAGSAPVGYLLAVLGLWVARDTGFWLIAAFLLLQANFILDTFVTLVRRFLRGDQWYQSHREHFYQHLVRSGKSHSFVTICESILQVAVLVFLCVEVRSGWTRHARIISSLVVISVWTGFFFYAESQFRRHRDRFEVTLS